MNIYSIYTNISKEEAGKQEAGKEENIVIIKQGFSLLAGVFGIFWALYYRLWFVALLIFGVQILINFLENKDYYLFAYSISISIWFLLIFCNNEIREYYLQKQGYKLAEIIVANSDEEAELRYIVRNN